MHDATVRPDSFWDDLRYGPDGLVPVVVQSVREGRVLMLAWANREAVRLTARERRAWFWSRSRRQLWRKGETSGHAMDVARVAWDCDADALLYLVEPHGPACHTANVTCFYRGEAVPEGSAGAWAIPAAVGGAEDAGAASLGAALSGLAALIAQRRREMPEGSYVAALLAAGRRRALQKMGEEAVEAVIAAVAGTDPAETVGEFADLCFHLLVALEAVGIAPEHVAAELERRHALRPER